MLSKLRLNNIAKCFKCQFMFHLNLSHKYYFMETHVSQPINKITKRIFIKKKRTLEPWGKSAFHGRKRSQRKLLKRISRWLWAGECHGSQRRGVSRKRSNLESSNMSEDLESTHTYKKWWLGEVRELNLWGRWL